MNQVFPGRIVFALAYLLLAAGSLIIHFTRVEYFSAKVGTVSIKGYSTIETDIFPPSIRRITLSHDVVEIDIRKNDKAVLVTRDNIRHPLEVLNWKMEENSVRVNLSDGVSFIIHIDTQETGFTLEPLIPQTEPPVRVLVLPFRPRDNVQIDHDTNRQDTIIITASNSSYVANLPSDSTWSVASGQLNITAQDSITPLLTLTESWNENDITALEWQKEGTAPSQAIYSKAVNQWLRKVRKGWQSRLNTSQSPIQNEEGIPFFSDHLAAAVLSDSIVNGNFAVSLNTLVTRANRAPRDRGWLSSPFLGDIITQNRKHEREMGDIANTLLTNISSRNPSYKTSFGLTYLLDLGIPANAEKLATSMSTIPDSSVSNKEIVNRLTLILEAKELGIGKPDPVVVNRLFNEFLLPRIYWKDEGLWLLEDDGSVDVNLNIMAGHLLLKQTDAASKAVYQAIGQQMIISSIADTDEDGMISDILSFQYGGDIVRTGTLAPEVFYPFIVKAPAYPRHVSLAKELRPGAWAITGAERFTLKSAARETIITMSFPSGASHHIAIKGIKPFNVLYMNGIKWNQDPNFQRYYAGWFFDENTETLYVKIYHRTRTETIRILYYTEDGEEDMKPSNVNSGSQ